MKVVFWFSSLSEHQVHLMRAISRLDSVRLRVVGGTANLPAREAQGWTVPPWEGISHRVLSFDRWFQESEVEMKEEREAFHVFGGLWADRRFPILLALAMRLKLRIGLVLEPYSDVPLGYLHDESRALAKVKVIARPHLYRAAASILDRRVQALFAISPRAEVQYARAGFPSRTIFPFGYFIARRNRSVGGDSPGPGVRAVSVGSMILRKGFDIAVKACRSAVAKGAPLTLDLFGPVAPGFPFEEGGGVRHLGPIPFGLAQEVIAGYDLAVVPSRFDGWCVVVNEALLQGVPVVVSSRAGASVLIEKSGAGLLFDPMDAGALQGALEMISADPGILGEWRIRACAYSPAIEPESAARYFVECLQHVTGGPPRPTPPWYVSHP